MRGGVDLGRGNRGGEVEVVVVGGTDGGGGIF